MSMHTRQRGYLQNHYAASTDVSTGGAKDHDVTTQQWRTGSDVWWREAQMLWRRISQREFGADHYVERYLDARR
jgi:hypothetical protein